jgi:hypothetical protein
VKHFDAFVKYTIEKSRNKRAALYQWQLAGGLEQEAVIRDVGYWIQGYKGIWYKAQ